MSTLPRDLEDAGRALERALRARLCVTGIRVRLRTPTGDLELGPRNDGPADGVPRGACMTLMIRDARGIVGDIDIVDACHPTCTGIAIREAARIVEAYAGMFRECLAAEPVAI